MLEMLQTHKRHWLHPAAAYETQNVLLATSAFFPKDESAEPFGVNRSAGCGDHLFEYLRRS